MMYAKVIADSQSHDNIRLTSIEMRYPRIIHSELMTHRVFSRNARSSRAVPVATLLREQPFVPIFGLNQRGMQAKEELPTMAQQEKWAREWEELAFITRSYVERWGNEGMHKQHANRPLEWFGWIDVLVTSTDWTNFLALRDHPYAQPELQQLAKLIKLELSESWPQSIGPGEWHLPYVIPEERNLDIETKIKLSVARSARVSYRPFDGNPQHEAEFKRHDDLVADSPVHASPAEHQATPDEMNLYLHEPDWKHPELHGNFYGWKQYRKTLPNEVVAETNRI